MNNLHRVFVAINISEKIKNYLCAAQDRYLELPARWARPENLHITLVFLGNTSDQEVIDVCDTVREIANRHDPFDLTLDRICYGPPGKAPRMVWVNGAKSAELGALQTDLQNSFFETGQPDESIGSDEERFFVPHVTLARIKQTELHQMEREEVPVIDEEIDKTFMVESIEVMESESKKGGPVYTVLESFKLGE
jgi:2'-5' RNA ligase